MYKATLASPLTCIRVSSATGLSTTPIVAPLTASSSACFWAANRRSLRYDGLCTRFSASISSTTTAFRGDSSSGDRSFSDIGVDVSIAISLTGNRAAMAPFVAESCEPVYALHYLCL